MRFLKLFQNGNKINIFNGIMPGQVFFCLHCLPYPIELLYAFGIYWCILPKDTCFAVGHTFVMFKFIIALC